MGREWGGSGEGGGGSGEGGGREEGGGGSGEGVGREGEGVGREWGGRGREWGGSGEGGGGSGEGPVRPVLSTLPPFACETHQNPVQMGHKLGRVVDVAGNLLELRCERGGHVMAVEQLASSSMHQLHHITMANGTVVTWH